ncbi:MAG TPA: hypothetical protein VMH87_10625 [Pseudomonadales bacterium]|nr:hypothetical protein [Pseudomonadales bacterium]
MQAKKTFLPQPEWIIAILITTAAVLLHLHFWLHIGGLWRDEVNQVSISGRHSFAEMAKDSFPILMPLTVHTWAAAGLARTDLGLRTLGLLVGLGILAALWISNWKIRRAPPLLGLALFGLNSSLIFFGDSIRAYGLGSLFAAALTATAFYFVQKPSTARAVCLGLLAILSVQVLYNNVVLVAAVCFGAWVVCWRHQDKRAALQILLVATVSAASLLPYTQSLIASAGFSDILRSGVKLPRFFASYTDTLGYPLSGYIWIWILLYAAIVFLAVAGSPRTQDLQKNENVISNDDLNLFAAVAIIIAAVGFPVFFWRAQLPMQSWYVLSFMALVAVCFDATLAAFRGLIRVVFLAFVAVTACISIPTTAKLLNAAHFSSVDIYAQALMANAAPKDYIIVEPWLFGITFNYYFKGTTPWDTLPPIADHSTHRFDLVQQQLKNTNAMAPVFQQITQTLQSGHRVWILADAGWMGVPNPGSHPPASLPPAPLPDTGWSDRPYTLVWASQTACFLSDHSDFVQVKSLSADRFITENVQLFTASGWKTNALAR